MGVMQREISRNRKAAIIVSHNIDLAIQFADSIIIIHEEAGQGIVYNHDILSRSGRVWYNYQGEEINDTLNYIKSKV